jgi:alpha-N-arabinofuranosidase
VKQLFSNRSCPARIRTVGLSSRRGLLPRHLDIRWFPGLPIYHSRDLVAWRLVGHVLDRPEHLALDGTPGVSRALCTHDPPSRGGLPRCLHARRRDDGPQLVTTARGRGPGPWSEPAWIEGAQGIDPSLLFDEDRVWYIGARTSEAPAAPGRSEIFVRQIDLDTPEFVGDEHIVWTGALAMRSGWKGRTSIGSAIPTTSSRPKLGTGHHTPLPWREARPSSAVRRKPSEPRAHPPPSRARPSGDRRRARRPRRNRGGGLVGVLLGRRPYGGYFCNWVERHSSPGRVGGGLADPVSGRRAGFERVRAPRPWYHIRGPTDRCATTSTSSARSGVERLRTPREPWWGLSQRPATCG